MAETKDRISGISVYGFKSFKDEQHVAIRPLTILAGANNSGKSSLMQPLLLLKQTSQAHRSPGWGLLLLDGPHVKFTCADQLLAKGNEGEFGVRIELLDGQSLGRTFRKAELGFEMKEMDYASPEKSFTIVPSMSHDEIMAILTEPVKTYWPTFRWKVFVSPQCGVPFEFSGHDPNSEGGGVGVPLFHKDMYPAGRVFYLNVDSIIHLPGLRGNPQRTYKDTRFRRWFPKKSTVGPYYEGTFEPHVATVIAVWQEGDGGKTKLDELAHYLESMALPWKVKAEPVDDEQIELKVGWLPRARQGGAHDLVNIAGVGFGVSQALSVLVALLVALPGQLVYLEQPEIGLHPLSQRRLAGVLRDAVKRGVVTVVETHSTILLRELQTMIATGDLDKEDVVVNWFARNKEGETTITTAELDDKGACRKWFEDFDGTAS